MIRALRGTQDILPDQTWKWQYLEETVRRLFAVYGYQEIRTPMFESTDLFQRGIGDTTDVVTKEMYTFEDRGKRSITLRPENTASAVRAYLEHKIYGDQQVNKYYYIGSMFRYDRPQAGRFREFHQLGAEVFGSDSPAADTEIIAFPYQLFRELGLKDLKVYVNSIGCPKCRPVYRQKLIDFFRPKIDRLCDDCRERLEKNPLRILDCKEESCKEASIGAPEITDYLCDECREKFSALKEGLDASGIPYEVDPRLVRGLDYYTNTAFEIQYLPLGAQSAICGGGRYDGLADEIGDIHVPGVGFAAGMERLILALEMQGLFPEENKSGGVFVAAVGKEAVPAAVGILQNLRNAHIHAESDLQGRSLKSQMKRADKMGASAVVIIGDEELAVRRAVVRRMDTSEQSTVPFEEIAAAVKQL